MSWINKLFSLITMMILTGQVYGVEKSKTVVRIAELEIDPVQLEKYTAIVKEEMDESIRKEPGVIAIYSVAEKGAAHKLRFFEIYASEEAYSLHIKSSHFLKYVDLTKSMIRSKKLIETDPLQLSSKTDLNLRK